VNGPARAVRVAGLVLAGGAGERLGGPKALRQIRGIPLIERVLAALRPVTAELRLSTRPALAEEIRRFGAPLVLDEPGNEAAEQGAVAGLRSGCRALAGFDRVIAVAVDLPFLSPALLAEMVRISLEGPFEAVLPGPPPGFEPLHAVYEPRSIAAAADRAVLSGKNALRAVLDDPDLAVRFVSRAERVRVDPLDRSIFNVNTPGDLARAEGWL